MRKQTREKRQEILRVASEVFGAKGYNKGSLYDIAEQLGMTHSGILHHFGSKDQLLLEVLAYRDETDVKGLIPAHIPIGINFFEHLIRTAFMNAQRAGIVQTFVVLSGEAVTENHPARDFFTRRYESLRDEALESLQVIAKERGVADTPDFKRAAASVLAVMDGLQTQWLLQPEKIELGESTEFAIRAIVSAVIPDAFE